MRCQKHRYLAGMVKFRACRHDIKNFFRPFMPLYGRAQKNTDDYKIVRAGIRFLKSVTGFKRLAD